MPTRYGVVAYDGEQLWQGKDDDTVVRLVKTSHEGIKIRRRRNRDLRGAPSGGKSSGFGAAVEANAKCHICGKTVYQSDRLGASGKVFHKACFRCNGSPLKPNCNKKLAQNDYYVAADGMWRCKRCHTDFEQARF